MMPMDLGYLEIRMRGRWRLYAAPVLFEIARVVCGLPFAQRWLMGFLRPIQLWGRLQPGRKQKWFLLGNMHELSDRYR